ncbi:MAG: NADH-ubiquinone oxidoreductase-F iron-sulfur binding region domain-containing protein [bacterium]|nr:NADH-ubiquinone oxidoreductase-F iron-sulfur binding region domain-containing protein [bacterium]
MNNKNSLDIQILVCMGTNSIASGGKDVLAEFESLLKNDKIAATLGKRPCHTGRTGCRGLCSNDVLVDIIMPPFGRTTYGHVSKEMVPKIFEEHIINQKPVKEWLIYTEKEESPYASFYNNQTRLILEHCGYIDPEDINSYIKAGGYSAFKKALTMQPKDIVEVIKRSRLRGRGGAGFPTGEKWEITLNTPSDQKYVICNAEECDPGTFKDRSLLEGDPHQVIEGIIIAGFAAGADTGFIVINPDYNLAIERVDKAIRQAEEMNFLGEKILNTGFNFKLIRRRGVKTFICGKSTALIKTLEGERGFPELTPPHSAEKGLLGKPTILNNTETFSNISIIISKGADFYANIGTEKSKGTKIFSLAGKVKNVGLVEVPMGTTLKKIIYDIGGGTIKRRKFKAVQVGGPLGGCFPESMLETVIDYEALKEAGTTIGSGGLVVMDDKTCMVDLAKHYLEFTQEQSCGKCATCRLGTEVLFETLKKITEGKGTPEDIQVLKTLSKDIQDFSLCGLGKTAPNPVLTTIKYFYEEYEEHINNKICRARTCRSLLKFKIDETLCRKCGLCFKKACKFNAIEWAPKNSARIKLENCVRCCACVDICEYNAIY